MARIVVDGRNFQGDYSCLNRIDGIEITRQDFRRAIFTLGSPDEETLNSRGRRRNLLRRSVGLGVSEFLLWEGPDLRLAEDFPFLEPTEKAGLSFWIGSALTKLVAEMKLGIPWLADVKLLIETGVLRGAATSKERPDYAGHDSAKRWHIIESKGRSSGFDEGLVAKAKGQAERVSHCNQEKPATTSACVVSLSTGHSQILLDDPEPEEAEAGQRWTIEPAAFFRHYYSGVRRCLRTRGAREVEIAGSVYLCTPLENPACCDPLVEEGRKPLHVGLLKEIFERPEKAPEAVRALQVGDGIGPDGIAVFE
jgi:hypothetical protein